MYGNPISPEAIKVMASSQLCKGSGGIFNNSGSDFWTIKNELTSQKEIIMAETRAPCDMGQVRNGLKNRDFIEVAFEVYQIILKLSIGVA